LTHINFCDIIKNKKEFCMSKRNVKKEKLFGLVAEYIRSMSEKQLVDFAQDKENGTTLCYVRYLNRRTGVYTGRFGVSVCDKNDRWNPLVGKYVALKRAVGAKIPRTIMEGIIHEEKVEASA
jgi:hypothetical protein